MQTRAHSEVFKEVQKGAPSERHQQGLRALQVYKEKKEHSKPPVSLLGQLLWREFYYAAAAHTPNYHQKEGNPICKQIPWDDNVEFFKVSCPGCLGRLPIL